MRTYINTGINDPQHDTRYVTAALGKSQTEVDELPRPHPKLLIQTPEPQKPFMDPALQDLQEFQKFFHPVL